MKVNPKVFYSHVKKFNKNVSQIGELNSKKGLVTDDYEKTEILSSQYASVWSVPRDHITSDDMLSFFGECNQCNKERVHICKYDEVRDHIIRYREHIMMIEPNA